MLPDLAGLTDADLARESRAGSLVAFEELVRRHETGVYRFLWSCLRNDAEAEELTQTVFVSAYGALSSYRATHSFGAWLFTIARHKTIDHCRSAARRHPAGHPLPEAVEERTPASILAGREERQATWERVRQMLPAEHFQALYLKYHEDFSVREIAQVLGRTSTSVKVLLFRARRALVRAWGQPPAPQADDSPRALRRQPPVTPPQPHYSLGTR